MSLRNEIINYLRQVGEATANDISRQLNVDINTIRSYMYILYKQNVVVRERVGKKYVYRLASLSPSPADPPTSSSSSTSNVKSFNVKSKNTDDMKNDIRNGLYNEKVNINSTFNVKSFNVKTTDAKVKNKYIFNLDSCLYELKHEIEKLRQEINELRSYIQSIFNVKSRSIFNVKTGLVEEEEGGGVRGSSPPAGSGVGREWAYTIIALFNARNLGQYLLQNSDSLSIAILEKLLTHYIITNNKFVVFNDYRELIEYFNLNVNDIIKSKQTINKAIAKLMSNGLIYFIKVNNNIKLGLKRKALKTILT